MVIYNMNIFQMVIYNIKYEYFLTGNALESVTHASDLGVIMCQDCKAQIEKAEGKASRAIAWVRNTVSRSRSVLLPIYKSLIKPHLEYCVQVWSPTLRRGNWAQIMP